MPNVPIAISACLKVDEVRVLTRSTETVPDTANRMDQRIGLLAVDLAADAPDIDVDDIGRGIEMKIPDVLQQHCPGYDAALVANQIFQKLEFPGKKKDFLAASTGGPRHQVDREIADAQGRLLDNGIAAPAKRLDARQQFDKGKRLDQIVIAAGPQAAYPIVDFSECTDNQAGGGEASTRQLTKAGGFRIVLDDQNTAVTSRHGLGLRTAGQKAELAPARMAETNSDVI